MYIDFTHITVPTTSNDVTIRSHIFSTNIYYSCAHFLIKIDETSSITVGFLIRFHDDCWHWLTFWATLYMQEQKKDKILNSKSVVSLAVQTCQELSVNKLLNIFACRISFHKCLHSHKRMHARTHTHTQQETSNKRSCFYVMKHGDDNLLSAMVETWQIPNKHNTKVRHNMPRDSNSSKP